MKMYRQGDILLMESERPRWGNAVPRADLIVAYGETTGHKHEFEGDVSLIDFGRDALYAEVHAYAKLVHDEHDTIEIPEGFYRVVRQREFDGEHIRQIAD